MRTNSGPTSKTKVVVGRVASKAAAGSRSRVNSPARVVSSLDNRADSRSRVKAVSRINAKLFALVTSPRQCRGVFQNRKRREDMKRPKWLRWESNESKSDNLKKIRQRTDQMMKRQAAQKELQEREEKKN